MINICKNCNKEFKSFRKTTPYCQDCCEINVNCHYCNKEFKIKRTYYDKKSNKQFFCSTNCKNKNQHPILFCKTCGKYTKHLNGQNCVSCHMKNLHKIKFCKICNKNTPHTGKNCMICQNRKINHTKFCEVCNKETPHAGKQCMLCHNKKLNQIKYCEICGKNTMHAGSMCLSCNIRKINHVEYCEICKKETIHAGNQCMSCHHKKIHVLKYCEKCQKETIHFNGLFCTVCNGKKRALKLNHIEYCPVCRKDTMHAGSSCNICTLKNINRKIFMFDVDVNCISHPDCTTSYKDICWECFKESKLAKLDKINIGYSSLYSYGFIAPTFMIDRTKTTGKTAFEQYLIDNNIGYFVYIKFIEKGSKIIPFQVAKSGSKLVNISGSDLLFSLEDSHGPARRFINENPDIQWYIENILIIPCDSEEDAYLLESQIQEEYDLFMS